MSKLKLLLVVACIVVISSTQFVFAESAGNQLRLASKGRVSVTSHFPGLIVWTNIKGQDASFLVRTEDGLLRVTAVLAESDQCEQEKLSLCFEGSIKSLKNNIAFKEGDTFKLGIDLVGKKEYFSFTSGFFENVDVSIDLQKIVIR